MQINSERVGEKLVLLLTGRFDASWSEYVGSAIESAIQSGEHQIEIDLGNVHYMSSAGIGVLLKYRKRLANVNGHLRVCNPVDDVRSILRLMRLEEMLLGPSTIDASDTPTNQERTLEVNGFRFQSYLLSEGEPLECEWIGQPECFTTGTLDGKDSVVLKLDDKRFCLGLGAFEDGQGDLQTSSSASLCRFGESLGIAGIAIEQPTDGSRVPDFQIARGEMEPKLRLLYGISGRGDFSHLIRLEAGRSERGSIRFSDFIEGVLDSFECGFGCFALVVEAATVVGASLIQSPTRADGKSPWSFPGIREWLSFTSEQNEDRMLALIVGVARKSSGSQAKSFVRPLRDGSTVEGHFHAAVFPYRPLPKGLLPMRETIHDLFKMDTPKSVLHLLSDDRPIEGVGQTELMRGACWFGPVVE
jgi:anti-anti-sigma factor